MGFFLGGAEEDEEEDEDATKRTVAIVARTAKLSRPSPVPLQKYVVLAPVLQGPTGVAAKTAKPR